MDGEQQLKSRNGPDRKDIVTERRTRKTSYYPITTGELDQLTSLAATLISDRRHNRGRPKNI